MATLQITKDCLVSEVINWREKFTKHSPMSEFFLSLQLLTRHTFSERCLPPSGTFQGRFKQTHKHFNIAISTDKPVDYFTSVIKITALLV